MSVDARHPAWDADLECRHGRVPFDPSPPCHCFPVEEPGYEPPVAVVTPLPVKPVPLGGPCACGCGEVVRAGRTWVSGHNWRKQAA
jgi:hypothetical protein